MKNMNLEIIDKALEISAKIAVPIGVVIMLWLQTQFVTRVEFTRLNEKTDTRLSKIEEVLIRMEASAEVNRRQDHLLSDHEGRIRTLEKGGVTR